MHNVLQIWTFCAHPTLRLPLLGRFTFFFALPRRSYFQCSFSPTPQHDCQDENVIKNLNRVRGESEKAFINFFETLLPSLQPLLSRIFIFIIPPNRIINRRSWLSKKTISLRMLWKLISMKRLYQTHRSPSLAELSWFDSEEATTFLSDFSIWCAR